MGSLAGKSLQQGKYAVEQELGRGGFGITYKATNTVLAQTVVLKTIDEALRQEPQFEEHQKHFQDEARRLARCFHPNIVRVTDFFVEDGLPHIAMDYVPGQPLSKLIQPGRPLPEATALNYIRQVSEAVEAIHQAGLLHRDIKPQNLILRPDTQQVIVIDFGIAREFTPGVTQTHTHLVSEGYAPIEQYLQQARRSPATDVYGLAATLYTLLTGQIPTAALLRNRVPLEPPHVLQPSLSPEVSAAVMQGMAVEPDERPQQIRDWLALLPLPLAPYGAQALSAPLSQRPTVVVAPQYRPTTPGTPGASGTATVPVDQGVSRSSVAANPPSQPSQKRVGGAWWLPMAVALSICLPLLLSYSWWRNQTTATPPAPSPETITDPSTALEPDPATGTEPAPVAEEFSPQPTNQAQEEGLATPAAPEVATPPTDAIETPAQPGPAVEVTPSQAEFENSEAADPAEEEVPQQEDLTREEERQQAEQAREEKKREREQEREARREQE